MGYISALVLAHPPQASAESGHEKALFSSGPILLPNCPQPAVPPPADTPGDTTASSSISPATMFLPLIILFGLYVQFHGDFGPGGGFQAGVIVGAALILYTLVFGLNNAARVAPPEVLRVLSLSGVLIYAGTGVANLLLGGDFLEYGVFTPEHPTHGQHYGILLIELGVGVTVSSTMILIFFALAGRGRPRD